MLDEWRKPVGEAHRVATATPVALLLLLIREAEEIG